MEKASNKNPTNLSKMLQKALSVGHRAAPFSPARDFRHYRTTSTANRGFFFSGPITPLVPTAVRVKRKTKNDTVLAEPTSPKVSCIGQIKLAKPKCPENKNRAHSNLKKALSLLPYVIKEEDKGSFSKLKRLFSSRKSNSTAFTAAVETVAAPSLSKLKKFESSRDALGGFDWRVDMREEYRPDHRGGCYSDDEDEMIPCSVSIPLSQAERLSLCPKLKSEVNLWERRSMNRPKPLEVKPT